VSALGGDGVGIMKPSDEFCGLRLSSDPRGFFASERSLCGHMPVPSPASKRIGPPQASDFTRMAMFLVALPFFWFVVTILGLNTSTSIFFLTRLKRFVHNALSFN
jgi:hypothetical protein